MLLTSGVLSDRNEELQCRVCELEPTSSVGFGTQTYRHTQTKHATACAISGSNIHVHRFFSISLSLCIVGISILYCTTGLELADSPHHHLPVPGLRKNFKTNSVKSKKSWSRRFNLVLCCACAACCNLSMRWQSASHGGLWRSGLRYHCGWSACAWLDLDIWRLTMSGTWNGSRLRLRSLARSLQAHLCECSIRCCS